MHSHSIPALLPLFLFGLGSLTSSLAHPSSSAHPAISGSSTILSSKKSLDCDDITVDGQSFDLSILGGKHSVHWVQVNPPGRPGTHNVTFTVDLCRPLEPVKDLEPEYQCPNGTRVCAVDQTYYDSGHSDITHVVPIAGNFDNAVDTLRPHWSLLKQVKGASSDNGIRLDISGGEDTAGDHPVIQMAVIDFVCAEEVEGDDVDKASEPDKHHDGDDKEGHNTKNATRRGDNDDNKHSPNEGQDSGRSLQFISYVEEVQNPVVKVLRLEWKTKHVCPSRNGADSSSGWGFFTWLLIIVFLSIAAFLIFGAFSRSGSQRWDQIPQSDFIADVPFMLRDFARRVVDMFPTGGRGGSGGYAPV